MRTYVEMLESEVPQIRKLTQSTDAKGFFIQEVLRFYTIAETLSHSRYALDASATNDERYLTHILLRSLLENYFTIIYLFDDCSKTSERYEELKNSFKNDYIKLMNDLNSSLWESFMKAHQSNLEPADPAWRQSNNPRVLPNIHDMLTGLTNDYGERLNYLYPIYRISSFDIHGRSLGTIFEAVFEKQCSFPVLNIKCVFELMANQYLVVLKDLRESGKIPSPT